MEYIDFEKVIFYHSLTQPYSVKRQGHIYEIDTCKAWLAHR